MMHCTVCGKLHDGDFDVCVSCVDSFQKELEEAQQQDMDWEKALEKLDKKLVKTLLRVVDCKPDNVERFNSVAYNLREAIVDIARLDTGGKFIGVSWNDLDKLESVFRELKKEI